MKTILFQGDSITDAGRSREDNANTGFGYPTFIAGYLGLEYPKQYNIINRGISGDRIVDLYARIKSDIINLKPDILSILIGVNDAAHDFFWQNGVEANKFSNIYSMLIEEIKEALPAVKIIIMEPFVLKGSLTKDSDECPKKWYYFDMEVKKRAEKAREIALKYDLIFISLQDKFDEAAKLTSNDYWLVDGVHPTAAGHELIKREWIKGFDFIEPKCIKGGV